MEGDTPSKETLIIIIHPTKIIRHALASLIKQSGYQIASLFDSCESLLKPPGSLKADLVLIHYSKFKSSGIIEQIRDQTGANLTLLASSDSYHKDSYKDMLKQVAVGVTGFLDMDEELHTFLSELDSVASGDIVISKNFINNLSKHATDIKEGRDKLLSERETEILVMVGDGKTNKEIGQELFISEHTVKVHFGNVLAKLNLENRQQAIAYILTERLVAGHNAGEE